jgi:hypothetical protein
MLNFDYYARTKIIFGEETETRAGAEITGYLKKTANVLLHHSGGHTVKSGLISRVKKSLTDAGHSVFELDGVVPNPRLCLVYKGIDLAKKEGIDFILAVGGGSVIDSAKAIALGAANQFDVWDFFQRKKTAENALPVGAVVTIPAAGSEGSSSCVITNEENHEKRGYNSEFNRPIFAILNPALTYSIPAYHTACSIIDMFTHISERYFTKTLNVELTDELCEGAMRTIIRNGRKVFSGGENDYNVRAELMWAGSLAHNNIFGTGRLGDWGPHMIEHELSAFYDIAHGAGLAIVYPAWMEYCYNEDPKRFARFACKVWGVDGAYYDIEQAAREGIFRLKNYFRSIGMPVSFADAGIETTRIPEMAKQAVKFGPIGNLRKLEEKDIEAIYRLAAV